MWTPNTIQWLHTTLMICERAQWWMVIRVWMVFVCFLRQKRTIFRQYVLKFRIWSKYCELKTVPEWFFMLPLLGVRSAVENFVAWTLNNHVYVKCRNSLNFFDVFPARILFKNWKYVVNYFYGECMFVFHVLVNSLREVAKLSSRIFPIFQYLGKSYLNHMPIEFSFG